MLDLQSIGKGWKLIEYNNKSELNLKENFLGVHPIAKDKLFIYGASKFKASMKGCAVFMIDKNEIVNVDNKLLEEIRNQARKSSKLSKIISTMSNLGDK